MHWTRTTRACLAALLPLALCACGGEEPSPQDAQTNGAETPAQPVLGAGDGNGADGAPDASASDGQQPDPSAGAASNVPFNDESPEAALKTYLDRLAAGDVPGALEICDPTAEGTAALETQIQQTRKAAADSGMSESMLFGLLTESIGGATHEETEREEDRVVYTVRVPNKQDRQVAVVRTLDGWRVQPPPASGLPI